MITIEPVYGVTADGRRVRAPHDSIMLDEHGQRRQLGIVGREPGASVHLLVHGMSEAMMEELRQLIRDWQIDMIPDEERETYEPNILGAPEIWEPEEEDEDE